MNSNFEFNGQASHVLPLSAFSNKAVGEDSFTRTISEKLRVLRAMRAIDKDKENVKPARKIETNFKSRPVISRHFEPARPPPIKLLPSLPQLSIPQSPLLREDGSLDFSGLVTPLALKSP